MKKILFLLMFISSSALAFDPSPAFKYGAYADNGSAESSKLNAFTVSLTDCKNRHCFSPFFIRLSADNLETAGIGADYIYKILPRINDSFHLALGVVDFKDQQPDSDRAYPVNAHIGVGVTIHKFTLSIDTYGSFSGRDRPISLLNMGVQF